MHSFDRLKLALIKTAKKKKTILPISGQVGEAEVRRTAKGGPGVKFIEDVPGRQSKGRGPGEGLSSDTAKALVRTADRADLGGYGLLGGSGGRSALLSGKKTFGHDLGKMQYHPGR
jgi:hypothetical protein